MIHGIYIKNRPKGIWHLVSIANSAEVANKDIEDALIHAKKEGYESAEVTVKLFESNFYIPEILYSIKEQKPLYN